MTTETKLPEDGGPIAPVAHFMFADNTLTKCVGTTPAGGLSILDNYATAALVPLVEYWLKHGSRSEEIQGVAEQAFAVGRAMLLARNRKPGATQ